jgi:hypothetical protein
MPNDIVSEPRIPVLVTNDARNLINVTDFVLFTVNSKQRSVKLNTPRVG